MFVVYRFGTLVNGADFAVGSNDPILDVELSASCKRGRIGLSDALAIFGMNAPEIFRMSPASTFGTEAENAQSFIGPADLVGRKIKNPTPDRRDALGLDELVVTIAQPRLCSRSANCLGDERCRRFQEIDLHFVPNSLAGAIVKADRAPDDSLHHDRNRQKGQRCGFIEQVACIAARLA